MLELLTLLFWIPAIAVAITVHEFAHAWAAEKLGDPTARLSDRLTLNPLKHYDPVGTTMLFVTAVFFNFPVGWAKPVPFDPYNLQNPKRDSALIALAGPVSNLLIASAFSLVLRFLFLEMPLINTFSIYMIMVNVALAIFNLVPIHPLDGGKILMGVLPRDLAIEYDSIMRRFGMFILILLIFPFGGTSAIGAVISPIVNTILRILLP